MSAVVEWLVRMGLALLGQLVELAAGDHDSLGHDLADVAAVPRAWLVHELGDATAETCLSTTGSARCATRTTASTWSWLWCGRRSGSRPIRERRGETMPRVRRTDPAAVRLPPDLVGPVDVELTRAVEEIPGPNALPGGSRYEPKFDGFLH